VALIVALMARGKLYSYFSVPILHRHLILESSSALSNLTGVSENQAGLAVFPNSAVVDQEGMVGAGLRSGRRVL